MSPQGVEALCRQLGPDKLHLLMVMMFFYSFIFSQWSTFAPQPLFKGGSAGSAVNPHIVFFISPASCGLELPVWTDLDYGLFL